jgi:Flp pilus assembly protein TadD
MRAAEISPNDYQLVTAAATALRMLDRVQEAEWWYRQVSFLSNENVSRPRLTHFLSLYPNKKKHRL